jgi:hypothetical protein
MPRTLDPKEPPQDTYQDTPKPALIAIAAAVASVPIPVLVLVPDAIAGKRKGKRNDESIVAALPPSNQESLTKLVRAVPDKSCGREESKENRERRTKRQTKQAGLKVRYRV